MELWRNALELQNGMAWKTEVLLFVVEHVLLKIYPRKKNVQMLGKTKGTVEYKSLLCNINNKSSLNLLGLII